MIGLVRRVSRWAGIAGCEIGWWIGGTGRLWWKYKVRATTHLLLTAAAWWQQQFLLVVALILPTVLVAGWARVRPVSYRRLLADRLDRWRLRRQVWSAWPLLMESAGLARKLPSTARPSRPTTAAREITVEVPSLRRLGWSRGQLVATPVLLTGQTVDDVELAADRLRVAVGARRCRVLPDPSLTSCRVVWSFGDALADPFDAVVPATDAPPGSSETVTIGRDEDGHPWQLYFDRSTMVAGSSGAGKASVIWDLVFALGPQNRAGLIELHGIDLKGGMELSMGRPIFTRYAQTAESAVAMLEDDARNLHARAERLAGRTRQHVKSIDEPTVVIVIDELAALIAYSPDRDLTRRAEAALSLILSQGRAVGYVVFAFMQDPRKETVRMRHLFTQSLGLRLRDREEVAMVLGDGALRHGANCHRIPASTPGVGYVLGEDNHPVRVRAGFVSDDMIRTAADRFPARHQIPIALAVDKASDRPSRRRTGPVGIQVTE